MFTRETLKNKIFALAIVILGAITILISGDATFFIFSLIPGLYLFFSKENWIECEYDDPDEFDEDWP